MRENGVKINITPQTDDDPSLKIISNNNPYFPLTPGISREFSLTFHLNWYYKMPEIISPYDFALEVNNGTIDATMEDGYSYSNLGMKIDFLSYARIQIVGANPLINSNGFKGFIDWS